MYINKYALLCVSKLYAVEIGHKREMHYPAQQSI